RIICIDNALHAFSIQKRLYIYYNKDNRDKGDWKMIIEGRKVKLFTLNANKPLAKIISEAAGIELSVAEVIRFADGEISINIEESVRGHDIFIVQPTSTPVNENLMELLIMIDALKRASAKQITAILPYYGYSR